MPALWALLFSIMKKLLTVILVGVLVSSCSEDEKGPSVERISDDYQPNTIGSTWTYSSFIEFTQTITNKTKSIDGKAYFAVKVSLFGTSTTTYMRKEGNMYINRETTSDQYDDGEYIFLKDDEVGTTWTEYSYEEIEDDLVETEYELEIIETGTTRTVGDEEFDNVIVVKVSSFSDGSIDPYVVYNYYAKGVGLIEIVDDSFGLADTELISYTIK